MKASAKYQFSEHTRYKQESLQYILEVNMSIVQNFQRQGRTSKDYLHYDLHAGPGKAPDKSYGSPLVFLTTAKKIGIKHIAHFYDCDKKTYAKLVEAVDGWPFAHCHMKDHNELIHKLKATEVDNTQYGSIYVDPSDTTLPIVLLIEFGRVFPRVDVIINFGCAGYKRSHKLNGYVPLNEYLMQVKPQWVIREPVGMHQWTMMLGSGWMDYPAWESKDFHSLKTQSGRKLLLRLAYTKEDLK